MDRFTIAARTLLCIAFLQSLAFAQNATPADADARLLPRSYVAVNASPAENGVTENGVMGNGAMKSPADNIGNFPALNTQPSSADTPTREGRESGGMPFSGSLFTVGSSLVVVLGLFGGLVWVTRRFGTRSMTSGVIPTEIMQSLGSSPIDSRTRITLVRCGNRILVLAQTATGIQPISEITDAEEVRQLTALCLGDSKKEFATTLRSIEQEKTPSGYVGGEPQPSSPRSHGRLFATA